MLTEIPVVIVTVPLLTDNTSWFIIALPEQSGIFSIFDKPQSSLCLFIQYDNMINALGQVFNAYGENIGIFIYTGMNDPPSKNV